MKRGIEIKLSWRFIALATWVISAYLAFTIDGNHNSVYLESTMIVMFPAVVSYGTVLRYLIARRLDILAAVVLCLSVGLFGIDLWSAGNISDRQVILVWLPMYQLCSFIVACSFFFKLMRREPVSVLFDMGAGKWPDRTFFMSILALHVLVPAFLLTKI